jgi:hypothetical protein
VEKKKKQVASCDWLDWSHHRRLATGLASYIFPSCSFVLVPSSLGLGENDFAVK